MSQTTKTCRALDVPGRPTVIYVSEKHGTDSNARTMEKPVQSLEASVRMSRGLPADARPVTIVVREGTYFLNNTPRLTSIDHNINLTVTSYKDEEAIVSGGRPLNFNWTTHYTGIHSIIPQQSNKASACC